MKNVLGLLKIYFLDRKNYKNHINIFLPCKDPKILVIILCSLCPIVGLISSLLSYDTINFNKEYILGLIKIFSMLFLGFVILYFLFLANQVVIDNGYIKNTEYLFKVKKIKITEIKSCLVTTGRAKGEAMYNLKIKSSNDEININMFIYSIQDFKKIVTDLGYPNAVKGFEKRVLTEDEKKKRKQGRKRTAKKVFNVIISILLIGSVEPVVFFTLSYYLEINEIITKIMLCLPLVIGWNISPILWKRTKKYSLMKMIFLTILSIIVYCLVFFVSGSLYSYLKFGHI